MSKKTVALFAPTLNYFLGSVEHCENSGSPKWSHLNALSNSGNTAGANGGNGGGGGAQLSGNTSSHLVNNNTNVHNFKTGSGVEHSSASAAAAAAAAAASSAAAAAAAGYPPHFAPHHGASAHHNSTISSQFSALLGASSAGYLLSSESKTMPIF